MWQDDKVKGAQTEGQGRGRGSRGKPAGQGGKPRPAGREAAEAGGCG